MSDRLPQAVFEGYCAALVCSFEERPPGRNESVLVSTEAPPSRAHRDRLVAELRASGLSSLASRLERVVIPVDHVLVVVVEEELRWGLVDVCDRSLRSG